MLFASEMLGRWSRIESPDVEADIQGVAFQDRY